MRACLFLALLLLGCGAAEDVPVYIDPLFNACEREEILRAGVAWNLHAVKPFRFFLEDQKGPRIAEDSWLILPVNSVEIPSGGAITNKDRHLIRVSLGTHVDALYVVSLHELGHVMGLEHVRHGAMQENGDRPFPSTLTDEDLAECRRVGACE